MRSSQPSQSGRPQTFYNQLKMVTENNNKIPLPCLPDSLRSPRPAVTRGGSGRPTYGFRGRFPRSWLFVPPPPPPLSAPPPLALPRRRAEVLLP